MPNDGPSGRRASDDVPYFEGSQAAPIALRDQALPLPSLIGTQPDLS
jgi:hypothetical protein